MIPARALLAMLLVAAGCRDQPCDSGISVSIVPGSGALEPGEYELLAILDGVRVTAACTVGADGLVDACGPTSVPPELLGRYEIVGLVAADEGFSEMFFAVDYGLSCVKPAEMIQHFTLVVRRGDRIVASDTWVPRYRGCHDELCIRRYSSSRELVLD